MNLKLQRCAFSALPENDYLNAPEQTIICTTNIAGAMGKGIALSVKQRYPKVWRIYRSQYEAGTMHPNSLYLIPVSAGQRILLFPTKVHWRDPSPVSLIKDNLDKLARYGEYNFNITSLAIPPLGMGNGKLTGADAMQVLSAIDAFASQVNFPCTFYS